MKEESIYDFTARLLDGSPMSLESMRGQVLLIVNTASRCGFTPQYAGLQKLFEAYKEHSFEVLAFPCNQFGAQEPGSAAEIGSFCQKNYGVTFPVFSKIDVNGPNAHPIFHFLKECRPGLFGTTRIKWNFTKFLVDRKGRVVKRFAPSKPPKDLAPKIEELLQSM
ncbi:MAG: glutathione peroxidase [Terracidiphilus sp.]|jgi:glutathione peroxidase